MANQWVWIPSGTLRYIFYRYDLQNFFFKWRLRQLVALVAKGSTSVVAPLVLNPVMHYPYIWFFLIHSYSTVMSSILSCNTYPDLKSARKLHSNWKIKTYSKVNLRNENMIYNTYLYQGNWSTDDMCFLKEIVLKFLSSIHHKTRSWKRRVLLAGCKVLTNGRRLKSSPLIFYEKRSLRFIASGLQTSREVWVFVIYMVISSWQRNVSSTAREAKKGRLDKFYDRW